MIRYTSSLAILVLACAASAADKYASPKCDAVKKCAIVFQGDTTATVTASGWNIPFKGNYNYDNAWTFSKIEVKIMYFPTTGGASRAGPTTTYSPETYFKTAGVFEGAVTANAPGPNEEMKIQAFIYITKDGGNSNSQNQTGYGSVLVNSGAGGGDPPLGP